MNNIKVWKEGEKQVADFLINKGYIIVYQNYFVKVAELDIVAILPKKVQKREIKNEFLQQIKGLSNKNQLRLMKFSYKNKIKTLKDLLVIVEVKSRSNSKFGSGFDAVDFNKINHMKHGAEILLKDKKFSEMQVRFDVASVDMGEIMYIEGAF